VLIGVFVLSCSLGVRVNAMDQTADDLARQLAALGLTPPMPASSPDPLLVQTSTTPSLMVSESPVLGDRVDDGRVLGTGFTCSARSLDYRDDGRVWSAVHEQIEAPKFAMLHKGLALRFSADGKIGGMRRPISLMESRVCPKISDLNVGLVVTLSEPAFANENTRILAEHGVDYMYCAIPNLGIPTEDVLIDILAHMRYTIDVRKKRGVVHCESGTGRTGLIIACYHVLFDGDTADSAIAKTRIERCDDSAVDVREQQELVHLVEIRRGFYLERIRVRVAQLIEEVLVAEKAQGKDDDAEVDGERE
jgi:protein-tyrosine phosphatase